MRKPAWLDALEQWLDDRCYDAVDWVSPRLIRLVSPFVWLWGAAGSIFGHAQFVPWLSFFATAAAAVATYFSYLASQQSADVSARAQAFTEKVSQDQIALARPVLSVMSGRIDAWVDGEGSRQQVKQRLELVIRNSGARSALPAWLAVYRISSAPSSHRSRVEIPWQVAKQKPEIPSSNDAKVYFDLGIVDQPPTDLLLALAYTDEVPRPPGAVASSSESTLQTRCSPVKVVWLHAARAPQGAASAPDDWLVTSATPLLLIDKPPPDGETEAEAAAAHLTREMKDNAVCAIPWMTNPS